MNKNQLLDRLSSEISELKRGLLQARGQMLSELQLTRAQVEVLMLLAEGPLTVGEIAAQLAVSQSASTQTIETMVKKGLVERRADEHDRRVARVALSPQGELLADRMQRDRRVWFREALAALSESELEIMITALHTLSMQFQKPRVAAEEVNHAN